MKSVPSAAETPQPDRFARRVAAADWPAMTADLNDTGCAQLPRLLTAGEAADIAAC